MSSPRDSLRFRPIAPGESTDAFFDLDDLAFHGTTPTAQRAHLGERVHPKDTFCAYDDGRLVGASLVWPATLSVPGGQLGCGAVSWVGVSPTHRRRGILTTMMESHLRRLAQVETPLAVLWASEATIYGRFGYGVASWAHSYDIRTRDGGSGVRSDGPGSRRGPGVKLIEPDGAHGVLSDIYARAAQQRAGVLSRDESWWTHGVLADPAEGREGNQLRVAVAGDPADGYALYRASRNLDAPSGGWGVLEVEELVAVSRAAAEALWGYLLSVDLVGQVKAAMRPTDDPLALMLNNSRTAKRTETDALWLRLVDLPGALVGRTWTGSFATVLEVEDTVIEANAGRWQLTCTDGQLRCARTTQPADLTLPTAQLAAIYLGGGSLTRAADAGLIQEHTAGAAEVLDRGARTLRAPWNVAVF